MALTVVVRSGELSKPASITFDAPRIVLGRGDGCEVLLPDPSISQRHASIRQRGTDYVVIDEGSTNGTFVGPVRLSPHAPRVLKTGDLLRLGRISAVPVRHRKSGKMQSSKSSPFLDRLRDGERQRGPKKTARNFRAVSLDNKHCG